MRSLLGATLLFLYRHLAANTAGRRGNMPRSIPVLDFFTTGRGYLFLYSPKGNF